MLGHGNTYYLEKTEEPNLWKIRNKKRGDQEGRGETAGYVLIYVDDILAVGLQEVVEGFLSKTTLRGLFGGYMVPPRNGEVLWL